MRSRSAHSTKTAPIVDPRAICAVPSGGTACSPRARASSRRMSEGVPRRSEALPSPPESSRDRPRCCGAAFPNKNGQQIVERLLTTAVPLDGMEISPKFGHGKLDLGAAMNPLGFLSLPMSGGGLAPLSASFIELPPGFVGPVGQVSLADTIVYDEQMFPFRHDLRTAFRRAGASSSERALREFMGFARRLPLGIVPGAKREARVRAGRRFGRLRPQLRGIAPGRGRAEPVPLLLQSGPADAGFHRSGVRRDRIIERDRGRTTRVAPRSGASGRWGPFAALAGRGLGMSMDWQWDENTTIDFASKLGEGYFGSSRARLASLGLTRRVSDAPDRRRARRDASRERLTDGHPGLRSVHERPRRPDRLPRSGRRWSRVGQRRGVRKRQSGDLGRRPPGASLPGDRLERHERGLVRRRHRGSGLLAEFGPTHAHRLVPRCGRAGRRSTLPSPTANSRTASSRTRARRST